MWILHACFPCAIQVFDEMLLPPYNILTLSRSSHFRSRHKVFVRWGRFLLVWHSWSMPSQSDFSLLHFCLKEDRSAASASTCSILLFSADFHAVAWPLVLRSCLPKVPYAPRRRKWFLKDAVGRILDGYSNYSISYREGSHWAHSCPTTLHLEILCVCIGVNQNGGRLYRMTMLLMFIDRIILFSNFLIISQNPRLLVVIIDVQDNAKQDPFIDNNVANFASICTC